MSESEQISPKTLIVAVGKRRDERGAFLAAMNSARVRHVTRTYDPTDNGWTDEERARFSEEVNKLCMLDTVKKRSYVVVTNMGSMEEAAEFVYGLKDTRKFDHLVIDIRSINPKVLAPELRGIQDSRKRRIGRLIMYRKSPEPEQSENSYNTDTALLRKTASS